MAGWISNYNFGGKGVNLTKNPLELGDDEATQLQNAELTPDQSVGGQGALTQRGGIAALTTALAGAVYGMFGWPLKTSYVRTLFAARQTQTSNTFRTTVDGTTWLNSALPLAAAAQDKFTNENDSRDERRHVTFRNFILYPGDGYTQSTTNPTVVAWDGTVASVIATVPPGPSGSGAAPYAITDMLVANGKVYIATHDPGGTGANIAGRVLVLDLTTGSMQQVANSFGPGTGEMTGGQPACLAWYQDQLWVGLNGSLTTNGIGKVVRCYPEIDTVWTADVSNLAGYVDTLCVFNGDLYGGCESSVSTGARIVKRTATTQAWTTMVTSASGAGGSGHYAHMIEYLSALYVVEYWSGADDVVVIQTSTDGTTWTPDLDVEAVDGVDATNPQLPGGSALFGSDLFFTFRSLSVSSADGYTVRKSSGSWTKVDAAVNISGPLAVLVQRT